MLSHFAAREPVVAARTAAVLMAAAALVTGSTSAAAPSPHGATADVGLAGAVVLLGISAVLWSCHGPQRVLLALAPFVGIAAVTGLDLVTADADLSGHIFFSFPVLWAASQLRAGAAAVTTAAAIAADALVAFTLEPPAQAATDVLYMTAVLVAIAVVLVRQGERQDAAVRELRERKQALTEQATHDALTGLPNRALFYRCLRQALAPERSRAEPAPDHGDRRAGTEDLGLAVLFCDLDGFKLVNDSLGHRAGDELLQVIAHRLRSHLRSDDVVARLGGDEFALLLHDADELTARAVADRLLAAFTVAVPVVGQQVHVGVSIGVTLVAPGARREADDLLREADVAMYEAKAAGRGRCVVFTPAMLWAQVEQASLMQDLHGAVARGEISVKYQPVVDLTTTRTDGLEALARWTHPRRGPIQPDVFIPLAERNGLVEEIGAFVLAEAHRDGARFAAAAGRQVTVGVNVSAAQLADASFLDLVPVGTTSAMQLLLEVTETTLVRDDVIPMIEELRRRGVRIAMDDFGIGQSSIAALRRMPLDVIKLDRTFISRVCHEPRTAGIVRAVTVMAHELGLALVAEGIETQEQRAVLTAMSCQLGQGYLFARPMSAVDMIGWLSDEAALMPRSLVS